MEVVKTLMFSSDLLVACWEEYPPLTSSYGTPRRLVMFLASLCWRSEMTCAKCV